MRWSTSLGAWARREAVLVAALAVATSVALLSKPLGAPWLAVAGFWSGRAEVECETAGWVYWYNATRIHHSIGKLSPIEFEEQYPHTNVAQPGEVA
jgi:transposase InsO family protein